MVKLPQLLLLYLVFPLLIFWWGWFAWWVALPCTLGLTIVLISILQRFPSSPLTFHAPKTWLLYTLLAFGWTYLAGVGGFQPQHFDYFKHNLILNNLIQFDWPVRYTDGTYLCYYHAYYLPAALLAKWLGGTSTAPYTIFTWTWLGVLLLFMMLHRLGRWKFVLFFMVFNSIEVVLIIYDALKSPHTLSFIFEDLWHNDHTIELIQTPGGLMFPSHVESFTAAPQHALPAWLITTFFIPQPKNESDPSPTQNLPLLCFLLILCLYWSPLVAVGLAPLSIVHLSARAAPIQHSALNTEYELRNLKHRT